MCCELDATSHHSLSRHRAVFHGRSSKFIYSVQSLGSETSSCGCFWDFFQAVTGDGHGFVSC